MSIATWSGFHTGHFVVNLLSMVSSSEILRYYRGIVPLLDFVLFDLGILVHYKKQKHSALIGLRDNTLVVTFSSTLKKNTQRDYGTSCYLHFARLCTKIALTEDQEQQLLQDKGSLGMSSGYRIFPEDCLLAVLVYVAGQGLSFERVQTKSICPIKYKLISA